MGKIWETRGGVGKSAILEHKSGIISETHKDRGKDTMEGLQELTNGLSNGIIPDPLWPPLPQDWGFATRPKNPKLQSLLGTYLRNGWSCGLQISPEHSQGPFGQKSVKNLDKRSVGGSRDCPNFGRITNIWETEKATNFKFCTHIHRIDQNKSSLKVSGKIAVGVVRDSRKILGHPHKGASRVIVAIAQLSCY